jgi:hypothetical protein
VRYLRAQLRVLRSELDWLQPCRFVSQHRFRSCRMMAAARQRGFRDAWGCLTPLALAERRCVAFACGAVGTLPELHSAPRHSLAEVRAAFLRVAVQSKVAGSRSSRTPLSRGGPYPSSDVEGSRLSRAAGM